VSRLRAAASITTSPGQAPARVAGSHLLSSDILDSVQRDGPRTSAAAFGGVVMVVLLLLRTSRSAALVTASLLLGVLWLGGAMMALRVKINFANFIAYPITFGIGVDYSVNVMTRYVQDGERDLTGAVRSTGAAVGLCSMTTIIGYSSLLLAKNRALFLFGATAVLGEVACLTAAVVALPALLVCIRRLKTGLARRRGLGQNGEHGVPPDEPVPPPGDSARLRRRDSATPSSPTASASSRVDG
jgi:predicted RND superfamily exporter protein